MTVRRNGTVVTADIHGMNPAQARRELLQLLDRLGGDVTELHVVHGYRGGDSLRTMVQTSLAHPRIARKMQSFLNEGETKIFLSAKGRK
ncbi:MAG: Smr/MutS family protein [Clostridia bacterium]|nr:Smr/MutS family protein [Clostridia bacterium]